jgi:hypothetical protein
MAPCPPPGVSTDQDAARLAAAEEAVVASGGLGEALRSMLPQSATGPIEDHDLMSLEFKAQVFLTSAWVPTYAEWFLGCDMEQTYRYERRVLQLLQWRCGPGRWQLKSPTHTLFLDAFHTVFPEARFVMTHREVGDVLPSVSDLYLVLLQIGNEGIDPQAVGDLNVEQWATALERVLDFRSGDGDALFFDIGFRRFQSDPIGQVGDLYSWLGRELTADTAARMRAWREANPRDKHGAHDYDPTRFGFDEAGLASRFGPYQERFAALLD